MHFNSLGCVVRANNGEMLAIGSMEFNLYQLDVNLMKGAKMSSLAHFDGNSQFFRDLAQEVEASQRK